MGAPARQHDQTDSIAERSEPNDERSEGVRTKAIVVGVDGSLACRAALRWASAHTDRLGPIQPVSGYAMPWWALLTTPALATSHPERTLRDATSALAERALAELDPSVPCLTAHIQRGSAGKVLVEVARGHSLLVVGSRGRNPLVATALGSVSTYCVRHSSIPVVVVPQDRESVALSSLVVGVDGTDPSEHALETARQAVGRDDVAIEKVIEFGDPASELAKLAASADALVIGRRSRKGLDRVLSDSVTTSVSHHLLGVLVVVPPNS